MLCLLTMKKMKARFNDRDGGRNMNIKQIVLDMINNNKENFTTPLYNHDGYATGYSEGYNDALVDLLNQLGIEHNEEITND